MYKLRNYFGPLWKFLLSLLSWKIRAYVDCFVGQKSSEERRKPLSTTRVSSCLSSFKKTPQFQYVDTWWQFIQYKPTCFLRIFSVTSPSFLLLIFVSTTPESRKGRHAFSCICIPDTSLHSTPSQNF